MQTFFIRHSSGLNISDATRERLWAERRIAVHYPHDRNGKFTKADNESLDPDDYVGKAKSVMRTFQLLRREGGYVCAQYFGQSALLLGTVAPNAKITLLRGKGGSSSRVAVLKTIQLANTKLLDPHDHSIIAASRPQQGTIGRWHAVGEAVAAIIEHRAQSLSWGSISSRQQEVACSEFLRLPIVSKSGLPRLQSLILPVGSTLKDVDIIGIGYDGKRIFAQVTYSKLHHVDWKLDKLRQFVDSKKSHVILFCSCDAPSIQDGIHIFPVQEVFRTLKSLKWGRQFLRGIR
ncbi:MAG: hypothetical protein ABI042_16310 [Verrucomicrobiota bacterium]